MAGDLRQISAALKMITDMERIGDQALDIAETAGFMGPLDEEDAGLFKSLAQIVVAMVTDSVDAYVSRDPDAARAVAKRDDEADDVFKAIKSAMIDRQVPRAHRRPRDEHRRVGGVRGYGALQGQGDAVMIYCVEDDANVRDIEVYALRSTGFEAEGVEGGAELFAALKKTPAELIILDVMLPGEDGLEILKKLRLNAATRSVPVIMATARGEEYDKINGLDSGADDYLVKPFGMMEMVSRVRAVLRRSNPERTERAMEFHGITIDPASHRVTANGREVTLTLKEYELLHALMSSPGVVFTRDRLLSEIWGTDYDGETRTVDVHIRTLRQKLGDAGAAIGTVRGVGYRMEA